MGMKEALEEVRLNLMAIDMNGDPGVDSFVNDSIEIINEALKAETAQEVSVQEQSRFVPEDSDGKYPQSVGGFNL